MFEKLKQLMTPGSGGGGRRDAHYTRFFGKARQVAGRTTSKKAPPTAIVQCAPTERRAFWTLVTDGMSDALQRLPSGFQKRTEVLCYARTPAPWMAKALALLAEYPFDNDTYLELLHVVPFGGSMTEPLSALTGFTFILPPLEERGFESLTIGREQVQFLYALPLTTAEMQFIYTHGTEALLERMQRAGLSPMLDAGRASCV
jgi:hypothetical protein